MTEPLRESFPPSFVDSGAWKESTRLKGRCGGSAAGHHLSPTFFFHQRHQPALKKCPHSS